MAGTTGTLFGSPVNPLGTAYRLGVVRRSLVVFALTAAVIAMAASLAGCSSSGSGNDGGAEPASTPEDTVPPAETASPAREPGISQDRVLFGQSAAFSGPAQELGRNMRLGIEAAFHEVNQRGGVHGRRLDLVSRDDAYEPEAAIANTLHLIDQEGVFALIGAVGTPTSRSATPVASDAGVPYIAPFTGAAFLRDSQWQNVINLRASYYQETEEMVARLVGDLGAERIAVMYQDDSFGRAGYRGVRGALERRGMEPVSIGVYPRNTTAVKSGLLDLQRGDPQAVILVGAYQPVAALIAWAKKLDVDAVFMTVSFVGSNALAKELGAAGPGVFVTQVVPFPLDEEVPIVSAYHRALSAYEPDAVPGFVSLEGYLAGRLAIKGLDNCGSEVSRACFLDGVRNAGVIDIEGFELRYGADDNQGSDAVFLTVIGQDGQYRPASTLLDVGP